MNDRLQALRLFTRVAHAGSFSAAARELQISQPSASRVVAALERELGATLFVRTTRAVALTETGRDYLARVEPLLVALEEADQATRGDGDLRGLLRIGVSSGFGIREVAPRLAPFLAAHPRLRVHLAMSDERQDLVLEGLDVALRLGGLPDSGLLARKISEAPRLAVASPAYLALAPRLAVPADLAAHAVIVGPGGRRGLTFEQRGARVSVRVDGRLTVSANEAAVAAATAGAGVSITSTWGCRAELERGDLVRVLPEWSLDLVEAHAIFPSTGAPKPSARAVADHLAASLRSGDQPLAPAVLAASAKLT